jgi:hypothetical protein
MLDRYWWFNRIDGLRAVVRAWLLPNSLCGANHPRLEVFACDKRVGHGGNHQARRQLVGIKRLRRDMERRTEELGR